MWSILFRTTQKFLQIHKKIKCHKQASRLLQPDQRQKQNHNREYSLVQQQPYQCTKRWIDIEPSEKNLASYDLSKKVSNFLRHNQTLQRKDDGAIEFYKIKFYLRNHHSQTQVWSDDRWKACLAAGGGSKRRYQYCSDDSGRILYLRALQGHSGHNLTDPMLQENVVIGSGFFQHIYQIGCAFNHSIINNGLILGGQNSSKRQTLFFLTCWSKKWKSQRSWTYWLLCTTSSAIRAQCMEEASRRGILGWYWSCDQRTFYQTRSNAIILQGDTSSLLHSKSWKIENWRSLVWKTILVSSTTTKDLIETRSQLDQRESIGFYSWTTASWKTRSTVSWRSTTC